MYNVLRSYMPENIFLSENKNFVELIFLRFLQISFREYYISAKNISTDYY